MRKLLKPLALCAVLLVGCGGGGDDGKNLFSKWNREGDGRTLDLSIGDFSTPFLWSEFDADASQCNCVLRILGDQASGSMVINQCYYVRGSSSRDPGCSSRNRTRSYTNSGGVLTVSGDGGSATFR